MKSARSIFAGVLLVCAGCARDDTASRGPNWKSDHVKSIDIRAVGSELLRTVQEPTEVKAFLACLENAEKVSDSGAARTWTHKIDMDGSEHWLYDASTGEFTILSMAATPMYRVSKADKELLELFLVKARSNQSLE